LGIGLVRENTSLSFEEYFWQNVDLKGKVILDAGTGFGVTTLEIAERIRFQKPKGKIISVDIDPLSFELARKRLLEKGLLDLVIFVKADLCHMPNIQNGSVDIVISTRTISDINSYPCRLTKAISEFYRVLKKGGQIVLSDELPLVKAICKNEKVAVMRWQLVKAISHLTGRPHPNEVEPDDLEFIANLVGFKECRYAVFKGKAITKRRIGHFLKRATEMATKIDDLKLRNAFLEKIKAVEETFRKEGGFLAPCYVFHARK
jgi:ubiquinone/menaquinone biosynthesis C-methylase UbiE